EVLRENGLAAYYDEWLSHPEDGDYWRQWNVQEHYSKIEIPVLSFGGWYDMFLGGTLDSFLGMRERGGSEAARRSRTVIGSWAHGRPLFGPNPDPVVDFGPGATGLSIDTDGMHVR